MAVVVEVVSTVRVPDTGAVPVMSSGVVTVQVGTEVPVVGDTAQVSATLPVNRPVGVTVIGVVLLELTPWARTRLPPFETVKSGVAELPLTSTTKARVWTNSFVESLPVTIAL